MREPLCMWAIVLSITLYICKKYCCRTCASSSGGKVVVGISSWGYRCGRSGKLKILQRLIYVKNLYSSVQLHSLDSTNQCKPVKVVQLLHTSKFDKKNWLELVGPLFWGRFIATPVSRQCYFSSLAHKGCYPQGQGDSCSDCSLRKPSYKQDFWK